MSDEELKLTRRLFLQHTAMATAVTGGLSSIVLKTDALAQATPGALLGNEPSTYPYQEPPG